MHLHFDYDDVIYQKQMKPYWENILKSFIEKHYIKTQSSLAKSILDFCTTLQQKRGFLPEHIDTIDVGGEMIVVVRKGNMMWKPPIAHEIAVGLEINSYSCAGL